MSRPRTPRPPRFLERVLERVLPPGLGTQGALGDLAEEYGRRAASSTARARLWYLGQAASLLLYRMLPSGDRGGASAPSDFAADVRWAMRLIARHPAFAAGVVGVLGLGLGANAAVFTVVDGTFRNTSWWSAPDRTVAIWPDEPFSFGQITMYAEEPSVYRSLGGYVELAFAVRSPDGGSRSVNGVAITPQLFRELAVQPVQGRPLADDDALVGVEPVAVVGEGLWRRAFGADPDLVGRRIEVGGVPTTVVGIQGARGQAPGGRTELWIPLVVDPRDDDYFRARNLAFVGVLREGADLDDAFAELNAFNDRLSSTFPMFYPRGFADGRASVARADAAQRRLVATPLLLLLGGTGLLLLVTALNVGNLLLGRAIERRRELGVRLAVGAGRGRILRQLLVEGAVLSGLAVGIGLAAAAMAGPLIARLFVGETVVASTSALDAKVLGFVLTASAAAWVVLSGVPAIHFLRIQRGGVLIPTRSGGSMQRALVAVQAGLATLLLVSATLLVATVGNLREVRLGFEPDGLLTVELSPPEDRTADPVAARRLYDRLVERVSRLPGVTAVGLTGWLPLRADAPDTPVNLRTAPVDPAGAPRVPMHLVDPGFFAAAGVEAEEGRLVSSADRADRPSAVVVNRTLADMLWPDGTAVGQHIAIDPHAWDRWVPVVGVVPDIRSRDMTSAPAPALYVSLAEAPARDVTLLVRMAGRSAASMAAIRQAIVETDPLVPVRSIAWMNEVVRASYSVAWVVMGLLLVLAALATVLGALGIYAVLARHVAASRSEIGVRLALGAEPSRLVGAIVRSGLTLAASGILLGSLTALWASRWLESLLFGVSTLTPAAYVAPALTLLIAAALATWVPAVRAGRLPPAEALRGP